MHPPAESAPTVCVIDSGIEEGHRWLEPAIDSDTSRCFLPGVAADDVADYVRPKDMERGSPARFSIPTKYPPPEKSNRLLGFKTPAFSMRTIKLPEALTPEEYLQQVVAHFHAAPRFTKIFNHSINANLPCPKQRMTSWAAKLDQLSHEQEVLVHPINWKSESRQRGLRQILACVIIWTPAHNRQITSWQPQCGLRIRLKAFMH